MDVEGFYRAAQEVGDRVQRLQSKTKGHRLERFDRIRGAGVAVLTDLLLLSSIPIELLPRLLASYALRSALLARRAEEGGKRIREVRDIADRHRNRTRDALAMAERHRNKAVGYRQELLVAPGEARREVARLGGTTRHALTNAARDWVRSEWAANREVMGLNKSAFARAYVRRVREEFDIAITDKTIREVWLASPPSASKPAVQQADG